MIRTNNTNDFQYIPPNEQLYNYYSGSQANKMNFDLRRSRRNGFGQAEPAQRFDPLESDPRLENSQSEAEPSKIFVGGIPPGLSEEDLDAYFSQFGEIVKIDMPTKKGRRGKVKLRGFAFIHYSDSVSVDLVLESSHDNSQSINALKTDVSVTHEINGFSVAVRKALDISKASKLTKELQKLKLFVKNLPLDATSEEINSFFSKFGPVNRVQITMNRGFAYVIISNKESYDKILKFFKDNHSKEKFDQIDPKVFFRGVHLLEVNSSISLT